MKSRAKVARACVAFAVGLSCYPVEAESPNRRTGGPSKQPSERKIYKTTEGDLLHSGHGGSAKSGMEPYCPPVFGESGVDGYVPVLDGRGKKEVDMQIHAAGIALDRAERHAAEWGHASIASAVLVETHSQSDGFYIDAKGDYNHFANAARNGRQGGASRLIEDTLKAKLEGTFGSDSHQKREDRIEELRQMKTFTDEQYQLELSKRKLQQLRRTPLSPPTEETPETPMDPVDPDIAPDGSNAGEGKTTTGDPAADAAAQAAAAAAVVADPATTTTTTTTTTNNPNYATADLLPKLGDTTNVFVDSTFTDSQTTLKTAVPAQATDDTPNLEELALLADHLQPSESDVMKTAASNMVMQKILNYLTKPVRAGSDHVPWFMVTQVSVSPGSRTFRDYAAETTLHPYYAVRDEETGRLTPQKDPRTVHPGIFAAFPLVEAQALDLRNSERYETQLSMAIAAKLLSAGKQTEAKFFLEKMTKIQQDIATRTMLPIVVPNSNGREVTYRFDPGLQALVDPGNRKKGSGMILQPNSVPALIVIMTDRKSLKCYSHLQFELHTRWIPKKKSNVWSATWDGIVRNYNPRTAMLPSDVMGAAASMDEAKRRLDWVSWKLGEMGVSSAYDVALDQGRMRCSALMSKIGSYQSNISLPVHFNVLPGEGLKLDSRYQQKIIVERVSGPETHSDLSKLVKVFIGGFPFLKQAEFDKLKLDADKKESLAFLKKKQAEGKQRDAASKQRKAEEKQKAAESGLIDAVLKKNEATAKRLEAAAKKERVELKRMEISSKKKEIEDRRKEAAFKESEADRTSKRIEEESVEPPKQIPPGLKVNAFELRLQEESLRRDSEDLLRRVKNLESDNLQLEAELKKLESDFVTLSAELGKLEEESDKLDGEAQKMDASLTGTLSQANADIKAAEDLRIEADLEVREASLLKAEVEAMGYFEDVDSRNVVITLPSDRTWTLPTATHAVTGEFETPAKNRPNVKIKSAITFGSIKLTDLDAVNVNTPPAVSIPPQLSADGIRVTVTGSNLDRVRSAYWDSSFGQINIVSQGKERMTLHIAAVPPKGTKEILISDSLPPGSALAAVNYSRNIVGTIPVTIQEAPKASLAVTATTLVFEQGVPMVKFEGSFPKGEVTVVIVSEFLTRTIVKNVAGDAKTLAVELERTFFSTVVGKEVIAKFTISHPDAKAPVTGSFPLYDGTVAISGVAPFEFTAAEINGTLDSSIQIFGYFPTKDPIQVFIGGIQVALIKPEDIKSPLVVPLVLKPEDKFHAQLESLKTKPGKKKLMIAFGGGLYEWKNELILSAN